MKYFAFLTSLIFVIYAVGFINKPQKFSWMDRDFTISIKGIAILTVVWAHSGAEFGVGGIQFIAGTGVALFLICSGYGLELSYQKKGLKHFWRKRFLKVSVPFWIVELVGEIATGEFTFEKYITTSLFIKTGWYLQYIAMSYILFFLLKCIMLRFKLNQKHEIVIIVSVFAMWFVIDSMFFANPDMPFLRARQMLSLPCGMIIAKYKNSIEGWMTGRKALTISVFGGGNRNWINANNEHANRKEFAICDF